MLNLFQAANYPEGEPGVMVIGDRLAWKRSDLGAVYAPTAYALKYALRLQGEAATEVEITAGADGAAYVVEVASVDSAAWTAGEYVWQAYITRAADSERVTVGAGVVRVVANKDEASADPRPFCKVMLDAIEALLLETKDRTLDSYSISTPQGGRTATYRSRSDLTADRDRYRHEYAAWLRTQRGQSALGVVRMRFSR